MQSYVFCRKKRNKILGPLHKGLPLFLIADCGKLPPNMVQIQNFIGWVYIFIIFANHLEIMYA